MGKINVQLESESDKKESKDIGKSKLVRCPPEMIKLIELQKQRVDDFTYGSMKNLTYTDALRILALKILKNGLV
jgi:hypothetical protein